jgi:hypothetical protein
MESLELAVIPAQAGIPQHIAPLDPRLRGDDGEKAFADSTVSC